MVNWAADFLTANPDLAARPFVRNRHGFTFDMGGGVSQTYVVGRPAHYDSGGGVMAAIDTALVDDGTFLAGTGTIAKIRKSNGAVERGAKTQRAERIVRYRPSNGSLSTMATVPTTGTVSGETWSRTWGTLTYTVRLHEEGVQETLVMGTVPSLPGGTRPDDYVMIEEQVPGLTIADGWLDAPYTDEDGYYYDLPRAWNGSGNPIPARRLVRSDAQGKWVLTGLLVSDVQTAIYPVTIDPDYAADSADGYVSGSDGTTYSAARLTCDVHDATFEGMVLGQGEDEDAKATNYTVNRNFLKFDTSTIPDGDTISAVAMKLVAVLDSSTTDFDVQIVKYDWSASDPVSAGNRETVYDGILAGTADDNIWRNTSGMATTTQYTSGALDTSWPSKTGYTYYGLRSSRDFSNTSPSTDTSEYITLATQDNSTSGYRPLLSVTHAAGGGTAVKDIIGGGIIPFAR